MANPEEDTPEYWNDLALEIFDDLKPEVDWMVDTLTAGGRPPGEVQPTLAMLKKVSPPVAMVVLNKEMSRPQTAAAGAKLFAQYLEHLTTQSLDAGGSSGVEQVAA